MLFRKYVNILFALLQGRKSLTPRQHQPHNYVCKDAVIRYIGQTKNNLANVNRFFFCFNQN